MASIAGKFLVGYMAVGGEKEYYLASVCPELYAPPGAYISVLGLKVQGQFIGGKFNLTCSFFGVLGGCPFYLSLDQILSFYLLIYTY